MKFNYALSSSAEHEVRMGDIYFLLPVYGDLLGEEYDVLEAEEQKNQTWNSRLLDLTNLIATERQISMWEVSKLMVTSELSSDSERFEILGDHVPDFMKLLAERPSEQARKFVIAATILKRIDAESGVEKVKKLPMKVVNQLVDFVDLEKLSGSHLSYEEAVNRAQIVEEENIYLRETLDYLSKLPHPEVQQALQELGIKVKQLKNDASPSSGTQ